MIQDVMQFQKDYFHAVKQECLERRDFREIYFFLNPERGTSNPEHIEQLYDRFVTVKRDEEFINPVSQVYQNNFKTLWNNALHLTNKLDHIQKDINFEINKSEKVYNECIDEIKKHEEKNQRPVRCGTYVRGNDSRPAYRMTQGDAPIFIYKWYNERLSEEKIFVQNRLSSINKRKNMMLLEEISYFVKQAILDGSFLWIHDLITLIDIKAFFPDIEREHALSAVRGEVRCEQLIRNSIGDPDRAKEGCKAIQELEEYIVTVSNGTIPCASRIDWEIPELLQECLKNELDNQELIDFILGLNLLSEIQVKNSFLKAFNYHVDRMSDEAKQLMQTQWIDFQVFVDDMEWPLEEALKNKDLDKARFIIELNQGKSPVDQRTLGSFFQKAVHTDNVAVLRFIHELAGEIPEHNMRAAIDMAKLIKCPKVLEYLKPHMSCCAIF